MDTRSIEAVLATKYGYQKLSPELSEKYRNYFNENTPDFLKETCVQPLYTSKLTLLCTSFDRIVIGDYGAFVEFSPNQANSNMFIIAPGQEYRINDPRYSKNCKYEWYTMNDRSNIKIYKQKRTVAYADYKPGKYYVSVHEVFRK